MRSFSIMDELLSIGLHGTCSRVFIACLSSTSDQFPFDRHLVDEKIISFRTK